MTLEMSKLNGFQDANFKVSVNATGKVSGGGLQEKLALSQIWLSLIVEGDVLPSDGGEPLTDWRIVVSPPLVIQNQLPVTGSFLVWEVPRVRFKLM